MWETRRVRKRPQGQKRGTPKASRWSRYTARPRRERITLTVHYRGGAECWYQVEARGSMGRFHGATSLHDVMEEVSQGAEFYTRTPDET